MQVSAAGSVKHIMFLLGQLMLYCIQQVTAIMPCIAGNDPMLLSDCVDLQQLVTCTTSSEKSSSKQCTGKGKHILPIVKRLLSEEEK